MTPPTERAKTGLVVIVSGPSGVGKTTIARALQQRIDDATLSVSVTTRAPGPTDRDGVDYNFVDDARFDEMIARGELLEWAEVFTRRYGTPRAPVEAALAAGRVVILEIDVRGAVQVRRAIPDALGLFILPPSDAHLLQRLRDRRRDPESAIQARFAEARREMDEARRCGAYDVFIVNDDLERAIREAVDAVHRARQARS